MYFQKSPKDEMKKVRCIKGKIHDIVLDIRNGSPTFQQYYAVELSAENMKFFIILEDFAHGFQSLEDDCEIMYLVTEFYAPEAEADLRYSDSKLDIKWPLPVADISAKDANHPSIADSFDGLEISQYTRTTHD